MSSPRWYVGFGVYPGFHVAPKFRATAVVPDIFQMLKKVIYFAEKWYNRHWRTPFVKVWFTSFYQRSSLSTMLLLSNSRYLGQFCSPIQPFFSFNTVAGFGGVASPQISFAVPPTIKYNLMVSNIYTLSGWNSCF